MNMNDKILTLFFETERWQYAIEKGVDKEMPKGVLYQLCKPETRAALYAAIRDGMYEIAPPHTALIPKDEPNEFREVFVNEPLDRVVLSIANDLLFDLTPDMVHPNCKSYLRGIGCGHVVQEVSRAVTDTQSEHIGWKSDLSKYFDSVPINCIDKAFDMVEERHGKSALIDVLRKYYHTDLYFDPQGNLCSKYQSLKQGCSVASWLADVVLYDIDERLSNLHVCYYRYSDDMLCVGEDSDVAMEILTEELGKMGMKLNPKKVEQLKKDSWFTFLGFAIKGRDISMSRKRIKSFQREINRLTINHTGNDEKLAQRKVLRYLYKGDGNGHSWATQILPVVNVAEDINQLNCYVMDCLRAVCTGKHKVGGLGFCKSGSTGCITRGPGRNVASNHRKTDRIINGYLSINCMQKAMLTSRAAYDCLVRQLL